MKPLRLMEDKWLNDIKDRLTDFEMEVPDGLWDSVNPENMRKVDEVKTKKRSIFYSIATAAAVLVGILTMGLLYYVTSDDSGTDLMQYTAYNDLNENPAKIAKPTENLNTLADASGGNKHNANTKAAGGSIISAPHNNKKEEPYANCNADINSETKYDIASNQTEDSDNTDSSQTTDSTMDKEPKVNLSLLDSDYSYPNARPTKTRHKKSGHSNHSGKFSFGMMTTAGSFGYDSNYDQSLSNPGLPNYDQNNPGINNPGLDGPNDNPNPGINDGEIDSSDGNGNNGSCNDTNDDNSMGAPPLPNGAPRRNARTVNRVMPDDQSDDITHHMPVKLGLTFLYRINDKIGVETGLAYTYLASDVKYGNPSKSKFVDGTQSLHYIGIPVNVKYRPFHSRWADVYLSGGMQFDQCVSSSVSGRYALSSSGLYAKERVSLGKKPFQVSANLSMGLQFNITPYLGIYAEPGVSYYFNDGSPLSTFYKEHPLSFNINAGLRLSLGPK